MATPYATARSGGRMPPHAPSRKRGAWKLAYADFLTALCAFFLVMWMINTPQTERMGVAEFFSGKERDVTYTSDLPPQSAKIASVLESSSTLQSFKMNTSITESEDFVRLDLFDTSDQPLFSNGAAGLNETGTHLLRAAGKVISDAGWTISVEGHTDSNIIQSADYSNWDLSAERANVGRRILEATGVQTTNFRAVTGLSDTRPLIPHASHLPANRRISIVIHLRD